MSGAVDVRASLVDGMVDHVCCGIQQAAFTTINDLAFFIDADKVGSLDQGEGHTEWIHPKRFRFHGIPKSDMTSNALHFLHQYPRYSIALPDWESYLIKAILPKDSESSCKPPFQLFALLVFIIEFRRPRKVWAFQSGLGL